MGTHVCELVLLGGFSVRVDGRDIPPEAWRRRRAAELVKILALADGNRLHREQVMDAMWPNLEVDAAGPNLRKAIHFARKALMTPDAIQVSNEIVELFPGSEVNTDVGCFRSVAPEATETEGEAASKAALLYTGELLPDDRYELWADEEREYLRRLAIRVFKAAHQWDEALKIDPTDEEAHRAIMQQALTAGDRTAAIRQFEKLRERLRVDLGMSPDQQSVAVYEQALASEGESLTVGEQARQALAWGAIHLNRGELDVAEERALESQRLAMDNGLFEELGQATALLSIVSNLRGRWRDLFRSEFTDAVRRSDETASQTFDAHLCVTEFHLQGPNGHEGIVEFGLELLDIARGSKSAHGAAVAEMLIGEGEMFNGRLAEAEEHLRVAGGLYEQAGAVPGWVVTLQRLAECERVKGNAAASRRLLTKGLALASSSPMAPHLSVRMHEGLVTTAAVEDAVSAVKTGEKDLDGAVVCPPCSVGFRFASIVAFGRSGEVALGEKRLSEVESIVGMWADGPWHAAMHEARGVLERARGNDEEAVTLFKEAAERFEAFRRPLDAERCVLAAQPR